MHKKAGMTGGAATSAPARAVTGRVRTLQYAGCCGMVPCCCKPTQAVSYHLQKKHLGREDIFFSLGWRGEKKGRGRRITCPCPHLSLPLRLSNRSRPPLFCWACGGGREEGSLVVALCSKMPLSNPHTRLGHAEQAKDSRIPSTLNASAATHLGLPLLARLFRTLERAPPRRGRPMTPCGTLVEAFLIGAFSGWGVLAGEREPPCFSGRGFYRLCENSSFFCVRSLCLSLEIDRSIATSGSSVHR